ncbi:hypothetical protein BpHYR1_004063 [Brachionus plicatilis]|uniref:Uncharacterized protein n=1 Tax=Brachionus plicatilis TaxID=10195 RepID=A0A3M7QYD5_BRAPC|nr:hypothetical protein BpHYR1_004063 [Brachionus plicatilis]
MKNCCFSSRILMFSNYILSLFILPMKINFDTETQFRHPNKNFDFKTKFRRSLKSNAIQSDFFKLVQSILNPKIMI